MFVSTDYSLQSTDANKWPFLVVLVMALLPWCAQSGSTKPGFSPTEAMPSYERDIAPLVTKYCFECHSGSKKRGGIVLDREKTDAAILKNRVLWEQVGDNLREGLMPPEGSKKPTAVEMALIEKWLEAVVFKEACTGPKDPGRVTLRRLNRAEYNNTIRDLVGVHFQPARDFPADDVGYGFDNIGDVLSLPPLLMEKYLAAADQIVEKAWADLSLRKKMMPVPPTEKDAQPRNLRNFASRAWRRPATEEEVKRLQFLVRTARDAGDAPDVGLRLALKAVLVSPSFLFRVEADPERRAGADAPQSGPISEWELASRLSYFMWSSMPDEELFELAEKGQLRKPGVIEAQVTRMLKSPKSDSLAENFAMQWLNLRSLPTFSPDPKRFPGVSSDLKGDMMEESKRFFLHVKDTNASVLEFLAGEWTFVNDRLAKHYDIKDVKGAEFRKISLKGTPRSGILTHASVLAVTSNPTRTSPVKRGKWVLENILGTPPPAPPPDVPELKEEGELKGSLREQMEQHRKDPNCASCHARMDPLGFGYENFDAVGRWRTIDGKHKIDASGVLPDGSRFNGPAELRTVLLAKKDLFVKCMVDKMLTYAVGRGMERTDRCFTESIAKRLTEGEYKFNVLVLEIVKSDPFQKRRSKGAVK
ncbi:MAG: DUF1592 domain-containing protein [Planctomycetia bacterium]|nr:DUF1592 domain-containing protein [Planctomycetia bacterium]